MSWFHASTCMEPYGFIRFQTWKRHEDIVWNNCIELHGVLDPGVFEKGQRGLERGYSLLAQNTY